MSIKYYIKHPAQVLTAIWSRIGCIFSDETYLKVRFRLSMGYKLDLKNPKTFNEKLNWLKLYDRKKEYIKLVDKYEVKEYVAKIIGEEHVIPTLAVWDSVDDIDISNLPEKFVLKATNGGGGEGIVICKNKSNFDLDSAKKILLKSSKTDWRISREWVYYDVKPRFIAEVYIEPQSEIKGLPDYKFFCFNGEVKGLFVATERQNPNEEVKFDFFDADYNHLPFRQGHEHAKVTPSKPENFELMKQIASRLSEGMPQARIDLYDLGDKVYFGEITLYHFGGFEPIKPVEWDKRIGELLKLPGENKGGKN